MKRLIVWISAILLCAAALACVRGEPEAAEPVAVSAPKECDVSLMLPLGARSDVTKLLKNYTDGFVSGNGKLLTFATETENPDVALSSLFEDGTLCILAVREGKTVVTVTAIGETGESAVGRINVTVRNARRILVLAVLGGLIVALLIVFGQPVKKQEPAAEADAEPETPAESADEPDAEPDKISDPEEIQEPEEPERSQES